MSDDNDTPFVETLPEEYRDNAVFSSYKDMGGLLKSHVELNKMLGKPRVDLPQDDWKDEDYDKFYSKLGRPEKAEAYAEGLELPEGVELDQDQVKWATDQFHKLGISDKAGKQLLKDYITRQIEQDQATQSSKAQSAEEATAALKAEWGDNYDTKMELVNGVAKKFGDDEFLESLNNPDFGNNIGLVKFIANVGEEFEEDVVGGSSGAPSVSPQARAKLQLDQNRQDPEKVRLLNTPLYNLREDEQVAAKALRAENENLYRLAYKD